MCDREGDRAEKGGEEAVGDDVEVEDELLLQLGRQQPLVVERSRQLLDLEDDGPEEDAAQAEGRGECDEVVHVGVVRLGDGGE